MAERGRPAEASAAGHGERASGGVASFLRNGDGMRSSAFAARPRALLALALLLGLAAGATPLAAQQVPAPVAPGTRVRVWSTADSVYGRLTVRGPLVQWSGDTIVLRDEVAQRVRAIPLDEVKRVDVSRGVVPRPQGILDGARLGFLIGAALAPLVVFEHWHRSDTIGDLPGRLVSAALFTGGTGAVVGGFLGTTTNHTRWERIR